MPSFQEATARQRVAALFQQVEEFLPPSSAWTSPHLAQLDAPVSFDDGVMIGRAMLAGKRIYFAAQEGGFMGGAVGEVHGAKLVGLMRRAVQQRPAALIMLAESGGVRLHEANAGLIAVSEVMRALLAVRAAGIPVLVLIGGSNGCFGGMGIVSCCANRVIMSEEARLAMSGPEVIETANGVEEFDSRDRALVWRTTGGKHRYLLGDCQQLVADDTDAFRQACCNALAELTAQADSKLHLSLLAQEQAKLKQRLQQFGDCHDPIDIWRALGCAEAEQIPMLEIDSFLNVARALQFTLGGQHV